MQKFEDKNKKIIFTTKEKSTRLKCSNCNCKIIYRNKDCKVVYIEELCKLHKDKTKSSMLSTLQKHYREYLKQKK